MEHSRKNIILTLWEGGKELSESGGGGQTQMIAMNFSTFVIGREENLVPVDELAQIKSAFFYTRVSLSV